MRVLIPISSFYPSQVVGPSNALYWLVKGLIKERINVTIVTTSLYLKRNEILFNKWVNIEGIRIIYLDIDYRKSWFSFLKVSLSQINRCDIVLTSGVCYFPYFFLNFISLLKRKKVIISPRGELFSSAINNKGGKSKILKLVYFKILKFFYFRKVIYHATSRYEVEAIHKIFGKKNSVVNLPNYMILSQKIKVQKHKNESYLLFVGRIAPIKSLDNLVLGLSKSQCFLMSNVSLYIAGEKKGNYYEYISQLVRKLNLQNKIKFIGLVKGNAKDELYAKAKCLYLVSKSENFGNVVIESLAQGTPVIASQGTPWTSLEEKNCGWWINNDEDSIAQTTDKLLQLGESQYENMRKNAYSYCVNSFDVYNNIYKWIEILK